MFEQKKLNIFTLSVHTALKPCPATLYEHIVSVALRHKSLTHTTEKLKGLKMTLANLKLTAAKKPTQISAVVQRRNRLVMRLREQIKLAKAEQNGTAYLPTKLRSVTDTETGIRKQVALPKRLKSWAFVTENGKLCVNVRYGARILELAKGKTAIEVATAKELVTTFETICAAVTAEELDAAIDAASNQLRSGFTK
ncbi:DUF6641 family protein [Chromobacterium sphagni]|uniref:DUF6641 family protein n=1 Tax=Chromobacterium sphagni TaxID=1903179 RepID=UPI0019D3F902|nr:DUF6641 family protein [Chromobacterium sphagni]